MHVGHTEAGQLKSVNNNNNEKKCLHNFFNVTPYTTCLGHVLQRIYHFISLC